MKLYFVAGERSGDLHGGNLIGVLRSVKPHYLFRGLGGDLMQRAGMELILHYRELAFMGFGEVIRHLGKIRKNLQRCKADIMSYRPDAVVLIDFAGFNLRIARFVKKQGIRVIWYIAPKVWAWNGSRVYQLRKVVDHMLVILPFEKEFFRRYGWEVDYVGNPVVDAVKNFSFDPDFCKTYQIPENNVALLPGSRRQEVKRMAPVFTAVARLFPNIVFNVPRVDNLPEEDYFLLKKLPNIRVLTVPAYDILANARAAVVTSGTATLETALLKVPQVVVYKTGVLSYLIGRALIKVPFISLVNLIAGRRVVQELIQHRATVHGIAAELKRLLYDEALRKKINEDYSEIHRLLNTGLASHKAAELIIKYLEDTDLLKKTES